MKRIISVLLLLTVILTFVSCSSENIAIEDCEWKMRTVMSNEIEPADSEAAIIAVGEPDDIYPNAVIVDVTLKAANGKITVTDNTNNKVYSGKYKTTKNTPKGTDYEIEIDGKSGYATVAPTKYYNSTEVPTLPINLGECSIYFIPND